MRTRICAGMLIVGLVALVGILGLAAQDRGDIAGTVRSHRGLPLPGVRITLVGPDRRTTTTNPRGEFIFRYLLPGEYEARFELTGFTTVANKMSVQAGQTTRLTVQLNPGRSTTERDVVPTVPVLPPPPPSPSSPGRTILAEAASKVLGMGIAPAMDASWRYVGPFNTEAYDGFEENPFRRVTADPLSTFSIDVDTASYANVRRFLNEGRLPPAGAVRIEELINYFRFSYPQPSGDAPFSITTELAETPWNSKHRLLLIGLQGRELPEQETPPRNLVFLIDVSGSMDQPDKLPLVRNAMRMLVDVLDSRDRVAIVVYAGSSGLVLPSTPGDDKVRIHRAIAELEAGGSTNGGEGIKLAYQIAREHFIKGGVNRVVLATDGDFNVGVTSQDELVRLIEEQRASGVFLSVLGVGTGNLKDSTMEKLADKGNGNYSYLDSLIEARKVLVREAGATLITIAKDVKIQVEFNPAAVSAYRLIGYENRALRPEDFNDDKKDAGEIGAGHSVTALYEIVPAGIEIDTPSVDPLRYQQPTQPTQTAASNELVTVKLRYKAPDGDESRLVSTVVHNRPQPLSANLGFASSVAEVGMLLRGSKHAASGSYSTAIVRARMFRQNDPDGYRTEFIKLAELAASLQKIETTARK